MVEGSATNENQACCFVFIFSVLLYLPFGREERSWFSQSDCPLHLYCDARSTPPRLAAVLVGCGVGILCIFNFAAFASCRGKKIEYCDAEPSEAALNCLQERGDNQIMSLELLSIALGLYSVSTG